MMDFLVNLGGVVATLFLLFEFITDGNAFLMFLGVLFFAAAAVAAMNSWGTRKSEKSSFQAPSRRRR